MEAAQLGLARLVLGELHDVAAGEEVSEELLLRGVQLVGALQFDKELLRGPLGRAEFEALFEVKPQRVGHGDAKGLGLGEQREGIGEAVLGALMRRDGRSRRSLGRVAEPLIPNQGHQPAAQRRAHRDPQPEQLRRQRHGAADVAEDVVGRRRRVSRRGDDDSVLV